MFSYAVCYIQALYPDCRYAECHYEGAVMLNVVAPLKVDPGSVL